MTTPSMSNSRNSGYNSFQLPTKNPQQMMAMQQGLSSLMPHLGNSFDRLGKLASGDDSAYSSLEAPAFRDLQAALGQTASRFSGMGTGARRSSGFNLAASDTARQLAENLQSQRLGLQGGFMNQLMSLYSNLLGQDTFENTLVPKQKPYWQEFATALAPSLGQAAGSFGGSAGLLKLFPQLLSMGK